MRKYLFAVAFLVTISTAFAVIAVPAISIEKVDPQPVEPGSDLTVDISLFNTLNSQIESYSVVLETSYPFTLKSATKEINNAALCAGCRDRNSYFLSVDPQAVSGTYPVYVTARAGSSETKQKVDIKIQGRPNLIFMATGDLNSVTPNAQFAAMLFVTNIGSGEARQVKLQPDSPNFNVLGGSVRSIDKIPANSTKQVLFEFTTSSKLEADSYSIPIRITYLDEQGNTINSTQPLGIKVVNKGEINVQAIKIVSNSGSASIIAGQPFTIVARLDNVGYGDADAISADVKCPFSPAKRTFLGQLKRDEDAPAVFELTTNEAGSFTCDLVVNYKDDTGSQELTEKFDVTIAGPNYFGMLMPLIIILAIIGFVFRKRIQHLLRKK